MHQRCFTSYGNIRGRSKILWRFVNVCRYEWISSQTWNIWNTESNIKQSEFVFPDEDMYLREVSNFQLDVLPDSTRRGVEPKFSTSTPQPMIHRSCLQNGPILGSPASTVITVTKSCGMKLKSMQRLHMWLPAVKYPIFKCTSCSWTVWTYPACYTNISINMSVIVCVYTYIYI